MIQKPLDSIAKADIDVLIANQVREARTIEYKQALPGRSDEEKREFLGDVSSFANAGGGDVLYGVVAAGGIPQSTPGLADDLDAEMLRLENVLRDGLEPRAPAVRMRPVEGFAQGPVLLVRIPKSWFGPHMIKFKNLSRFFSRNSAGKYQLDVSELRAAFLLSEALPEKMRRFRDERLGRIIADETPVPLRPGAKLVLHILPHAAFAVDSRPALSVERMDGLTLHPFRSDSAYCGCRYNLDGLVFTAQKPEEPACFSYTQLFRDGQIEIVTARLVKDSSGRRLIGSEIYERCAIAAAHEALNLLASQDISFPVSVLLSLVGVKDSYMGYTVSPAYAIDRDILVAPDVLVEQCEKVLDWKEVARMLRPAFDAVWNACGYPRSMNYDDAGNWNRPERPYAGDNA